MSVRSWHSFLAALLLSGCPVISFREVQLPTQGPTYEVECQYTARNCLERAKKQCHGAFEQITLKNCPRCDPPVPLNPEEPAPFQLTTYRGFVFFRCL